MDHQPDVQEQQFQHHHHRQQQQLQNHQNSANIVYIQQNLQDYQNRGQDSAFINENEANLIGNQAFQQQNANFGQFENHYTYIGNGNFSPSNTSSALIPGFYNKGKNVSVSLRRTQFITGNEQDGSKFHDCVQYAGGNYGSTDLQRITYQQPSHFFLAQNVGNQYPLSDMLVPTCQSSGSSESSDDSSISNVSQQNYSNDSTAFPNPHLEFTVPVPVGNQTTRNYNHFQQKEFTDNYMSVIQQDSQIPRCDSNKSETTESTCSSLSSGSGESQTDENAVRLPVLVNPVINNNSTNNILNSYESNTHDSINTFTNQMHHNQMNEVIDQRNYRGIQNHIDKMGIYANPATCGNDTNLNANANNKSIGDGNRSLSDVSYINNECNNSGIHGDSNGGGNNFNKNSGNSNVISDMNQKNNLLVVFPNRINNESSVMSRQPAVVNPSLSETMNTTKLLMQNARTHQRVQQQKIFGLINIHNQTSHDKIAVPVQMIKLNNGTNVGTSGNNNINNINVNNSIRDNNARYVNIKNSCANVKSPGSVSNSNNNFSKIDNSCLSTKSYTDDNQMVIQNIQRNSDNNESTSVNNNNDNKNVENCNAGGGDVVNDARGSGTSHIQNTSDSSVINTNFIQSKPSTNVLDRKENDCAMLIKETSDKCISQCSSGVSSSMLNSNVYLVKSDQIDLIKNNCYGDSSIKSYVNPGSNCSTTTNVLPVPIGWKRLLMDGSIVYLSPSNAVLRSVEQVKMYLQTMGTCKCGLECPVNCDSVFNFNPKVVSRPWDPSDSELARLCNHKRKAPTSSCSNLGKEAVPDKSIKLDRKEITQLKKKKKKHGSGYSGVSVSQLLAQRDRALAAATATRWPATVQNGTNNFQNVQSNQYQVLRNQSQDCNQQTFESKVQVEPFKPAVCQDDKNVQYPFVNVVGNVVREGGMVSLNGVGQIINDNNSGLFRTNFSVANQTQKQDETMLGHPVNYNPGNQEFAQNSVVTPRPEGVVMTPQGLLFPPNMLMHRPRSIPPWHQSKFTMNKKQAPQGPVLYDRIPSLHQHMPPPTLLCEDFTSRKKHKTGSKERSKKAPQESSQNQPSFMEDPNAYLAQQTALLHSTISRPNFNMAAESQPAPSVPQTVPNTTDTATQSFGNNIGIPLPFNSKNTFNVRPAVGLKVNQNDFAQIPNPQRTAVNHQKVDVAEASTGMSQGQNVEIMNFNNHVCSNVNCSDSPSTMHNSQNFEGSSRPQKANEKNRLVPTKSDKSSLENYDQEMYSKYEWRQTDGNNQVRHERLVEQCSSVDENPVTSSTEKIPQVPYQRLVTDSRPIQGGTVSTSNGSPQPQSHGSPNSSTFRQDEQSPKSSDLASLPQQSPVTGNVLISSSTQSPFSAANSNSYQRDMDSFKTEMSCKVDQAVSPNTTRPFESLHQTCESPDGGMKVKMVNRSNCTSSDQKMVQSFEAQEQIKNPVTSTFNSQKDVELGEKGCEPKGSRFVRTMASGHTASSNTITSVLAGKAQTATVTVNNNSSVPPTISLVNFTNQNVINVPMPPKSNVKSPLEMVQSVVSSIQTLPSVTSNEVQPNVVPVNKAVVPNSNMLNNVLTSTSNITPILTNANGTTPVMKAASNGGLPTGHIIVSNNAQYIVASNGIPQTNISGLKLNQTGAMPPMSGAPVVTNAAAPVTQVLPAVGVAQQVLGQPTVLVNALPAPFVIQPGVMAVDTGLGHLAVATGNVLQSSLIENDALRTSNIRGLLSPDKSKTKKGNKKRKNQVASIVQMASPNNMIINQPFNQQNFAVSPGGSIQALTLVSSKHGGPAQIVMNNQNNFNQFNSQPQQINLLQPVNITPNFPAFQQFIVPGLGNMVMATDGTATILPDANIGVQLQLQNVNGQNMLTPLQNTGFINGQGILTTPGGMLIRAPNQQKVIQSNSNAQFLSPNSGQFLVNQFQGQLSPLITANLSPNQQIYTNSPSRQSPQEFIQIIPTSTAQNTTVVQQNTTIVQQQTTMVSNNQNILNPSGKSNFILNNPGLEKPIELQIVANPPQRSAPQEKIDASSQHSVSTQTSVNKDVNNLMIATSNTFCQTVGSGWSGSPPDTTTHSPVDSESNRDRVQSPPTATSSDCLPQAMVQYVSSSINESESDSDAYLLSSFPNLLNRYDGLLQGDDRKKNVVESSTLLQESGIQIQVERNYASQKCQKTAADESVVSSHSDMSIQDKRVDQCISFQDERSKHSELTVPGRRSDDFDNEDKNVVKEQLNEGDLVWGSVRGSSAWPGKLVGPISSDGRVMVRWFGGHMSSPTRVNINQLQSLSQGLEAHHKASNKGRKNRKLNIELEAAIQEAMLELDKKSSQQKKITTGRSRRTHR